MTVEPYTPAVHSLLYVYVAEVFPTSVRSIGTAFALFGDEIGETLAPFVLLIDKTWICYATFACMATISALLTLSLPETLDFELPETLAEMKNKVKLLKILELENCNF